MELFLSFIAALAVFFLVMLIGTALMPRTVKFKEKESNFSDICEKIFRGHNAEVIANHIGIATDKYAFSCNVLGREPHMEMIVFIRLFTISMFLIGMLASLLLKNYIIAICVAFISFYAFILPTSLVQSKARKRQAEFEGCLPRYLDLLQTALKVQIPVAAAIKITAESVNGLLSEELLRSLAKSEIGAENWQSALYEVAEKYEVDAFSDFVMDVVTAFSKGTDISESVERQCRDIKQTSLLKAKENASKVTSTILIPIAIFKMMPLMVMLFLPIIIQLMTDF